jgi:hypothetical protein
MKYFKLIILIFCAFALNSCLKNNEATIVLPEAVNIEQIKAVPIEQVVPEDILEKIKIYMPIYSGYTPPNVEGAYISNPDVLVYSSDGHYY